MPKLSHIPIEQTVQRDHVHYLMVILVFGTYYKFSRNNSFIPFGELIILRGYIVISHNAQFCYYFRYSNLQGKKCIQFLQGDYFGAPIFFSHYHLTSFPITIMVLWRKVGLSCHYPLLFLNNGMKWNFLLGACTKWKWFMGA